MTNLEKYSEVFVDSFNVGLDALPTLAYQSIPTWDSVGHMELMAQLEEIFDIMLEADDIIDFSSFEKGKEILAKHNVEL